jgi:hypothetical protein
MQINAITSPSGYVPSPVTSLLRRPRPVEEARRANSARPTAPVTAATAKPSPGEAASAPQPEGPGVLRLLEDGHFKGVADVRLRINFFDELSARADQQAVNAASDGTKTLLSEMSENLEALAGSLTLTDDQSKAIATAQEAFTASIEHSLADFGTAESREATGLHAAYAGAFDAFIQDLQATLQPAPTPAQTETGETGASSPESSESAASEEPGATPVPAELPDLTAAFADLVSAFTASLDTLMASVNASSKLSDPAPYSGSGKAYDKFAAIYNQMRGVNATDPAESATAVDVLA